MKVPATIVAVVLSMAPGQERAGAISGAVRDREGGVIPGVVVVVTCGSDRLQAITTSDGRYQFHGLRPGKCWLEASMAGFRRSTAGNIVISGGAQVEHDFVLQLSVLTHADFVEPVGGFPGALRTARCVLHLRVVQVVGPELLGVPRRLLTTEHRARALSVVKGDGMPLRRGEPFSFWQVQAGTWTEDGQRFIGQNPPYRMGDELVSLFDRDEDGRLVELSGGAFVFRVQNGSVAWHREPIEGIRATMPVEQFVRALVHLVSQEAGYTRPNSRLQPTAAAVPVNQE